MKHYCFYNCNGALALGLIVFLFMSFPGCNRAEKQQQLSIAEGRFLDNKKNFLSLTNWIIRHYTVEKPVLISPDSLPKKQRDIAQVIGLKKIFAEHLFCSMTDTRGQTQVTYQVDVNGGKKEIYVYLVYSNCISNDLLKTLKRRGQYKKLNDNWIAVQKKYDWLMNMKPAAEANLFPVNALNEGN